MPTSGSGNRCEPDEGRYGVRGRKPVSSVTCAVLLPVVLALLSAGAARADYDSEEKLREAAGGPSPAEVRRLLAEGASPNARDARGRTAVHLAAANHREPLGLLLEAGGECCLPDGDGNTPLHHAVAWFSVARNNPLARVRLLLKAGADPDRPNRGGNTSLHLSAKHRSAAIVNALLKAGADPGRSNGQGDTPLHAGVTFGEGDPMGGGGVGDVGVVRALLAAGAAPDAADSRGRTPLRILAGQPGVGESAAVMTALLRAGADPNRKDRSGDTLLHLVIENQEKPEEDQEKEVRALLAGKADPCLPNAQRYLPIHVARRVQSESIEELLARAGGHDWRCDERALAEGRKNAEEAAAEAEDALGLDRSMRRRIQSGLAAERFDPGLADGLFGPRTRAALRGWQEARGKAVTGYLDEASARALLAAGEEPDKAPRVETETAEAEEAAARAKVAEAERAAAEARRREAAQRAEAERKAKAEAERRAQEPGRKLRDCEVCPEMVVVPSGSFMMGSPESEGEGSDDEKPVHEVTIGKAFAVGVYEVTFGEWDACASGGGCNGYRPDDRGWGRGRRPVVNVSREDAQLYVEWLSRRTGKGYRLLSESEWEYAARAGTTGRYHWGNRITPSRANYVGNRASRDAYMGQTAPVGSYSPNGFGLHDVHGNVWEWVGDCWNGSYEGAPADGSVWEGGDCGSRVLRGGSWYDAPELLRSASRSRDSAGNRGGALGFRVARTLD